MAQHDDDDAEVAIWDAMDEVYRSYLDILEDPGPDVWDAFQLLARYVADLCEELGKDLDDPA